MEYDEFLVQPALHDRERSLKIVEKILSQYKGSEDGKNLFSLLQFGLSNPAFLFRKRADANDFIISTWAAKVYQKSLKILALSRPSKFKSIEKPDLEEIGHMSIDNSIIMEMPELLLRYGIVLVYEAATNSLKADGVTFISETGHLVIGISFRFSRIDHFWFTLMHELAHAHLNYNNADDISKTIDLKSTKFETGEIAANKLAKQSFVKKHIWANCQPKYDRTSESIFEFSKSIKVHPAIIAGMLQYEENNYSIYRDIVDSVDVRKLVFR